MTTRLALTRRRVTVTSAAALALTPLTRCAWAQVLPAVNDKAADTLFQTLDTRIEAAMKRHHVPGVAVGVSWQGREHVRGFGVTNVDHPLPVDGDTLFRIGSTTKTFTATAMMCLVEQGKVALAAPVRTYLSDLALADETAARSVTVRQLLNHSAGWLGDDYGGPGRRCAGALRGRHEAAAAADATGASAGLQQRGNRGGGPDNRDSDRQAL